MLLLTHTSQAQDSDKLCVHRSSISVIKHIILNLLGSNGIDDVHAGKQQCRGGGVLAIPEAAA